MSKLDLDVIIPALQFKLSMMVDQNIHRSNKEYYEYVRNEYNKAVDLKTAGETHVIGEKTYNTEWDWR